jgi:pyrimidine-nucleoside phosphorylase
MNVVQLIAKKRDGRELSALEIDGLINGYTRAAIPEYQMAAWAMAVLCRGMTPLETASLTQSMLNSGRPLTWNKGRPKVDKHSTGGIGDKTSIPMAPILADCGLNVPMISGRGLGATGGTLDKLESIAGFRTNLDANEIRSLIERVGCVITGASGEIAPADQRLYALRDVTATVPSIPLITASILSKKLSEGLDCLVLDVKWGTGAFMKSLHEAQELARSLLDVATQMGVKTRALITDMNRPLGRMIGNGLEVDESIDILKGCGPTDVTALTVQLCAELLQMAGCADTIPTAMTKIDDSIRSGRALERLHHMVRAQGGDLNSPRPRAAEEIFVADRDGYLVINDCEALGLAVIEMGGGRKKLGDPIDFSVGIEMLATAGQPMCRAEPIARVYSKRGSAPIKNLLQLAMSVQDEPVEFTPLIVEVLA